jgi:hypothetical protein
MIALAPLTRRPHLVSSVPSTQSNTCVLDAIALLTSLTPCTVGRVVHHGDGMLLRQLLRIVAAGGPHIRTSGAPWRDYPHRRVARPGLVTVPRLSYLYKKMQRVQNRTPSSGFTPPQPPPLPLDLHLLVQRLPRSFAGRRRARPILEGVRRLPVRVRHRHRRDGRGLGLLLLVAPGMRFRLKDLHAQEQLV